MCSSDLSHKLLPYRERLWRLAGGLRTDVIVSRDNGPQEIERLLRHRWVGRRSRITGQRSCQYWVKWFGLPAGFNSWVDANIIKAQGGEELIRAYLRENPAARDAD